MTVLVKPSPEVSESTKIVNDFNINVATANGSGSQTSNSMLIRSLFKMGIPVTGKNMFPSNIQGLPTWYNIRLSKEGYLARREAVEVMICMNGATVAEDMASVAPGGLVLYDGALPIAAHRKDVTYYAMPVKELVKAADLPFALRLLPLATPLLAVTVLPTRFYRHQQYLHRHVQMSGQYRQFDSGVQALSCGRRVHIAACSSGL